MYLFLTAYLLLAIPSAAAVLRQKQTPVVAIAWLLAIVLLPIGGSLFYLLAGYRKPVRDVPPTDSRPAASSGCCGTAVRRASATATAWNSSTTAAKPSPR